ncbi:MAG TPA: alanine:cation symporter family protein, partial [Chlamydiales bacterium]
IRSLGKFNAVLVPVMALIYIVGGLLIIGMKIDQIPGSFALIIKHAFTGQAAFGGFLGAGVMSALQMGIVRGISSNEAGLGSAPIAAAAAKTDVPGRQALVSMTGVFLSSFIVCTITVLVLCVTGVIGKVGPDGTPLNGAPLVIHAFNSILPGGSWIVAVGVLLFGFSTILGWSYYGEKCLEYLTGGRGIVAFRLSFVAVVLVGSMLSLEVVLSLVDIMNGLMALPNLIALFFLSPIVLSESKSFFALVAQEKKLRGRESTNTL